MQKQLRLRRYAFWYPFNDFFPIGYGSVWHSAPWTMLEKLHHQNHFKVKANTSTGYTHLSARHWNFTADLASCVFCACLFVMQTLSVLTFLSVFLYKPKNSEHPVEVPEKKRTKKTWLVSAQNRFWENCQLAMSDTPTSGLCYPTGCSICQSVRNYPAEFFGPFLFCFVGWKPFPPVWTIAGLRDIG